MKKRFLLAALAAAALTLSSCSASTTDDTPSEDTVSIRVGRPIETAALSLDDRDALIARVREAITGLLAEGPIGTA